MYKVPNWFGDITAEEIEKASSAMADYEKYCSEFQNREKKPGIDDDVEQILRSKRNKSPVIKAWSVVRFKT